MKLKEATITAKQQPRRRADLARPVVFCGPHRRGKTTILEAIACALGSSKVPQTLGNHGGEAEVLVDYGEEGKHYRITRKWIPGGSEAEVEGYAEGVAAVNSWLRNQLGPVAQWRLSEFMALQKSKTQQRRYIQTAVGLTVADLAQAVVRITEDLSVPEELESWVKEIVEGSPEDRLLPIMQTRLSKRYTKENGRLRDMTGLLREADRASRINIAGSVTQAKAKVHDLREQLDDSRTELATHRERSKARQERADALARWRDELSRIQDTPGPDEVRTQERINEALGRMEDLPETKLSLDNLEEERVSAYRLNEQLKTRIEDTQRTADKFGDTDACPLCGHESDEASEIREAVRYRLSSLKSDQVSAEARLQQLDREIEYRSLLLDVESARKMLAGYIKIREQRIERLRENINDLDAIEDEEATISVQMLEAKTAGLKAALAAAEEERSALEESQTKLSMRLETESKVDGQRRMVESIARLKDALGPNGLMGEQLLGPMRQLVGSASELLSMIKDTDSFGLQFDKWVWGIQRGDELIAPPACSGSERALLGAALGWAVSQTSTMRLLIVDDIDILLSPEQDLLLKFISRKCQTGELDNFIGAMAFKKKKRLERYRDAYAPIRFVWVEEE